MVTKDFSKAVYPADRWHRIINGALFGEEHAYDFIMGEDVPDGTTKCKIIPECGYVFRESATNPGTYVTARVTMHPATAANYNKYYAKYNVANELKGDIL